MVDDSTRAAIPQQRDVVMGTFDSTEQRRTMKVPIPRLKQSSKSGEESAGLSAGDKQRVSHACEPCRQRKTKCSGERPICKHCTDFKITCFYAGGKRDRAKNEMASLKSKVDFYEQLLGQLKGQVDSAGQLAINKALQGQSYHSAADGELPASLENRDGESLVSAEVGSTGSLDHIREDVNTENTPYPTGYMGKSSEVAWIQTVARQLAQEARQTSPPPARDEGIYARHGTRPGPSFISSTKSFGWFAADDETYQFETPTYHLDDLSITIPSGTVDPFLLPDKQIADDLVAAFFQTVHPSFPVIMKGLFMSQYNMFFQTYFPPASSKRWLAMLNLIFAIGSLYGKLANSQWKGTDMEHLKFFARARSLCLDDGSLFETADMQQVQVVGLTGMYLLASNQTNRAWNVIGLSIRYAQTLGLNLRNTVPDLSEVEKELRARVWHSLYGVEHLLCLMTGRPSAVRDQDCSVPLPRPIDEQHNGMESFEVALRLYTATMASASSPSSTTGAQSVSTPTSYPSAQTPISQSSIARSSRDSPAEHLKHASTSMLNAGLSPRTSHSPQTPLPSLPVQVPTGSTAAYFLEHIKLARITCAVLSGLYSPATVNKSWSDVQGIISSLELELVTWKAQLPPFLDFTDTKASPPYIREQMSLGFQYHHARILINRPCLCRLDYQIPNESSRSRSFNRSAAATCICAAREIVAYLEDENNFQGLITVAPWWCILHYVVAAGVILMVEISMRAEHNPQQADGLLRDTKKVVRWLRAMSKDNIAAERSWAVLNKLLIVAAPKIGGDTSDVERDLEHRDPLPQPHLADTDIIMNSPSSSTQVHPPIGSTLADMPYLFRGQFDDAFRFNGISPHHHLDSMLATLADPSTLIPSHAHTTPTSPIFHDVVYSSGPRQSVPTIPTTRALSPRLSSSRPLERLKKRHSLGVTHIDMPPPPAFAQWSTPESSIGFAAESAKHGKADFEAAVCKVANDSLTLQTGAERPESKKRSSVAD